MKRFRTFFSMMFGTFSNHAQEQLNTEMQAAIKRQQEAARRLDNLTKEILQNTNSIAQLALKK